MLTKTILVTGGAGYIGSHVCKVLAQEGFLPIAYDNLSLGHRWAVKWGPLIEGDILDKTTLTQACLRYRPVGIIHLAALSNVRASEKEPLTYYQTNITGTLNLLEVAQRQGIAHFVFSSTCAVYGMPKEAPICESHPKNPISTYGHSKWMVEKILTGVSQRGGLHTAILRYFNAAGADPDGEIGEAHNPETHLLPLAIETALQRRPSLHLYGVDHATPDGTPIRDFIHVTDLAKGHVRALKYLMTHKLNLTLNLGVGKGHSVKEIITSIEQRLACTLPIKIAPSFPGDPPILVAKNTEAMRLLNWSPAHSSLEEIIATAVKWHRR